MQATAETEDVEATVISSSVGEIGSGSRPGTLADEYTVAVHYRYTYEGETYTSSSMCPGAGSSCVPTSDSRSDMEAVLEDYEKGTTLTASVSPADPSEASLFEKEPSLIYLGVSAFCLVFVLLSVRDFMSGES